jgi:hypothetical protein
VSVVSNVSSSKLMGAASRARSSILHGNGGSRFIHNIDNCLPDYMVSEHRGPWYVFTAVKIRHLLCNVVLG